VLGAKGLGTIFLAKNTTLMKPFILVNKRKKLQKMVEDGRWKSTPGNNVLKLLTETVSHNCTDIYNNSPRDGTTAYFTCTVV